MDKNLAEDFDKLASHYNKLAGQFGYSHNSVQQSSKETQEKRFEMLLEGVKSFDEGMTFLDIGCGAGHFLEFLKNRIPNKFRYIGVDISSELLKIGKEHHPDGEFVEFNVFSEPIDFNYDYAIISGVFNNRLSENKTFFSTVLKNVFPKCNKAVLFNCLSTYVDFKDESLFYFDPAEVFSFCKENLSVSVVLKHDYEIKQGCLPFEFSCFVYKSDHSLRKRIP